MVLINRCQLTTSLLLCYELYSTIFVSGSAPSTPTSNIQPKQAKRKSAEEIVKSCFEPSKKKKKKKGKGFI